MCLLIALGGIALVGFATVLGCGELISLSYSRTLCGRYYKVISPGGAYDDAIHLGGCYTTSFR